MSAEKWESVTWDWVEREFVDYLLIANRRPEKSRRKFVTELLATTPSAASVTQKRKGTTRRSSSNA